MQRDPTSPSPAGALSWSVLHYAHGPLTCQPEGAYTQSAHMHFRPWYGDQSRWRRVWSSSCPPTSSSLTSLPRMLRARWCQWRTFPTAGWYAWLSPVFDSQVHCLLTATADLSVKAWSQGVCGSLGSKHTGSFWLCCSEPVAPTSSTLTRWLTAGVCRVWTLAPTPSRPSRQPWQM